MATSSPNPGYRRGPLRTVWPSPSTPLTWRKGKRADAEYGVSAEPDWRGVDWPAQLHTATIAGSSLRYADIGSGGRPVVFIHGLGGCWQNWLENLPQISQTRRVIAVDLPGFGGSELPRSAISISGFADAVDELCEQLDLGPVAVVGNSMGGFTTAELAIRHPRRVERAVLVDAAGISSNEIARNPVSQRFARAFISRSQGDPRAVGRMLRRPGFTALGMGIVARYPTRIAKDLLAEQLLGVGAPGFMPAFDAIAGYDFVERLGEIACPTLIVQGTEDVLVPVGDAYEFERRIPDSTTLILEDTGHVPMFERPRTFNRALLEFLDQDVDPATPDPQQSPTLAESASDGPV